jgi:hypothetical protein
MVWKWARIEQSAPVICVMYVTIGLYPERAGVANN